MENITEIMKTVLLLCLFFITTCLAIENSTTKLEQQLNIHKREKEYLIEDDPNYPEQKRDERQSTPAINNRNLDPNVNSRIINIRLQPPPSSIVLAAQKQGIKPGPQRIPTKIPLILKTAKVVPNPLHAARLKMLENKIDETLCNAKKQNNVFPNNAPPTMNKDSIPHFTIEDKTHPRSEIPKKVNDESPDLGNVGILNRDGKETSGNKGNHPQNKDDQVAPNSDKMTIMPKPVHFYVDEPEPLPLSFRKQLQYENTSSQNKEIPPNKIKEMPIRKKGNNNPKNDETSKIDDENDPDIVKMSNGTHIISIKKIPNNERYNNERFTLRSGEEDTVPSEGRIVNQPPPEPKPEKPVYDEPEKHSFSITEKININKEPNWGLMGLPYNNQNKEVQGQNIYMTKPTHDCEKIEEKTLVPPPITLQPSPPITYNNVNQESWNYLQNPYYNPYYQNVYDQYRRNYGQAQTIPNLCGQELASTCANPCIYNQATFDPYVPEIITPYLSSTTDTDSTQYSYKPYAYESLPEIDDNAWPRYPEVHPEYVSGRIRKTSKEIGMKMKNPQINGSEAPLDIDIRRDSDRTFDEAKVENAFGKVTNPYTASTQPININGALVYPYANPSYRYMR